jgi:hypothetical protein
LYVTHLGAVNGSALNKQKPVEETQRQVDLAAAAAARKAQRQKLIGERLGARYVSFEVWQALRSEHPALFAGVGGTWRTTTPAARALLTVIIDDIYGQQGCRHHKGYLKIPGETYLAPLFDRAEPYQAVMDLEEALDAAGVGHELVQYSKPLPALDVKGRVRAIKPTYGPRSTEAIGRFRKDLKRGILETPIRLDSPDGKPRRSLPPQKVKKLREKLDRQIAACQNPIRQERMRRFAGTPSFKQRIADRAAEVEAELRAQGDREGAAAVHRVAEVGRSWVFGSAAGESTRCGGSTSPGSLKAKYRRMLFPDGIELDLVAGSLHNAAEIAPGAGAARELLRGWAELGLDPYTMMASEVLATLGRPVADQLKFPEMLSAARARCKKIMTPLIGGARPDQLTTKPLEYFVRQVPITSADGSVTHRDIKMTIDGTEFLAAALRHPLCGVPAALYGKDGTQGLARDLRELGRCKLADGRQLRMPLGETGAALDKRARRALFLELDRMEGAGILAALDFVDQKCAGKLRYQMDLHDGLGLHRCRKDRPHHELVDGVCRAMEEGIAAAGGFGRCRVAYDPLRGGEQRDEATIAYLRSQQAPKGKPMTTFASPPIKATKTMRLESLPEGDLQMQVPLDVQVDKWADDGMFTAHWDDVHLHADSYVSAEDAVAKLGAEIVQFHAKMSRLEKEGKLRGVLLAEWRILEEVVERKVG